MQVVDAQIHLWGSGLPSNMAHRQVTSFTAAESIAMMDEAGVAAAVIHPPPWDPGAHELALAAVRDYPGRFAIMGSPPLEESALRSRIATWRDQPGMLGLRYLFLGEPACTRLRDGSLDWLWAEAERALTTREEIKQLRERLSADGRARLNDVIDYEWAQIGDDYVMDIDYILDKAAFTSNGYWRQDLRAEALRLSLIHI